MGREGHRHDNKWYIGGDTTMQNAKIGIVRAETASPETNAMCFINAHTAQFAHKGRFQESGFAKGE
jgi:hypothetical protein